MGVGRGPRQVLPLLWPGPAPCAVLAAPCLLFIRGPGQRERAVSCSSWSVALSACAQDRGTRGPREPPPVVSKPAEPETRGHRSCWPGTEAGRHAQAPGVRLPAPVAHPGSQSPAPQHRPRQPRGFRESRGMRLSLGPPPCFLEIHPLPSSRLEPGQVQRGQEIAPREQRPRARQPGAHAQTSQEGISPEDPATPLAGGSLSPPPTQPPG